MRRARGFTLVELLTAVAMLALLGLMSYRGLHAVLETQERVARETDKWRSVTAFLSRFERDVQLAAARPARAAHAALPAFVARASGAAEWSRMPAGEPDFPLRVAYVHDSDGSIALMLWPGLDSATATPRERHTVLENVERFELHCLDVDLTWHSAWPSASGALLPLAVRVRIVLLSGEDVVRIFAVKS